MKNSEPWTVEDGIARFGTFSCGIEKSPWIFRAIADAHNNSLGADRKEGEETCSSIVHRTATDDPALKVQSSDAGQASEPWTEMELDALEYHVKNDQKHFALATITKLRRIHNASIGAAHASEQGSLMTVEQAEKWEKSCSQFFNQESQVGQIAIKNE